MKRRSSSMKEPRFILVLQPLPGIDPIRSLRWVLKGLLRRHGMKCVDLHAETEKETSGVFLSRPPIGEG
jgi:hypothetical protein